MEKQLKCLICETNLTDGIECVDANGVEYLRFRCSNIHCRQEHVFFNDELMMFTYKL